MVKVESNTAPVNVAIARFSDIVDKVEVDAHAQHQDNDGHLIFPDSICHIKTL